MLRSALFAPTLREAPAEAVTAAHRLLLRAGYMRRCGASGIYSLLPLGVRVLEKLNNLIDAEMQSIGGQKLAMPLLLSAQAWRKTGRWESTVRRVSPRERRQLGESDCVCASRMTS